MPLDSVEALSDVASRLVFGWHDDDPEQRRLYRSWYIGDLRQLRGHYHVTWTEGSRRPLQREALWRVGRAGDEIGWVDLDMAYWTQRCPHWLREALSSLLVGVNGGLRDRDLSCLPDAPPKRSGRWRRQYGVGAVRSLRLDDFCPDGGPELEDVIHLGDLPELLWLVAGFAGAEVGDYSQRCLDLTRRLFEVLGATDHWLCRNLPVKLEDRSQVVAAATQAPSKRVLRTLCDLWGWRDRLMVSAEPWGGIMLCQHPVLRGRGGKRWSEWPAGEGGEGAEGEMSDLLADLGDDIAMTVLDNIDVARRIGAAMAGLWDLGPEVDEPVCVREALDAGGRPMR